MAKFNLSDASKALDSSSRSFRPFLWLFIGFAIIFFARLLYLQIFVAPEYTAMASQTRTISYERPAHRGTIYDRNGVVLAVSVDSRSIYCNPKEVENAEYAANALAPILDKDLREVKESLTRPNTTFVYLSRQADVDVANRVKELHLDGIYFIDEQRREYPNGAIGGQVIGVCDVDGNGICGLELYYDEILAGKPGTYSAERGEDGTPIPGAVREDVAAIDGEDIMISLDIKLQSSMEEALATGVQKYESKKGNSIVMDAATGEIYAACAYPYLDPTDLANSEIGSDNLTAITQYFEPGSVFKSFSALGVLETGAIEPEDEMFIPSKIKADEYYIKDAHDHGDLTLTFSEVLDQSSNIGISLASEAAGFEKLDEVIGRLKLLEKTGVDYPGEPKYELKDYSQWSMMDKYSISFGQGIATTPMQIVRAYGAIANDGVINEPHFLMSKPQTNEFIEYESETVIDDMEALAKLKSMMRTVVTEGTGEDADIEGFDVVGKTSTAEIAQNGEYAKDFYNLGFAGFIDNSNSKLVCFTSVNEVRYMGKTTPIFHDIMKEAIDLYKIVPMGGDI